KTYITKEIYFRTRRDILRYPRIIIDTKEVRNNVKTLVNLCNKKDIEIAGVTKGICAHEDIVDSCVKGGVNYLADSRVQNMKELQKYNLPKIMLRLPMISEVGDVVRYSIDSLYSVYDILITYTLFPRQ